MLFLSARNIEHISHKVPNVLNITDDMEDCNIIKCSFTLQEVRVYITYCTFVHTPAPLSIWD